MITTSKSNLEGIKNIIKGYDKRFSKYDGELDKFEFWEDSKFPSQCSFNIPILKVYMLPNLEPSIIKEGFENVNYTFYMPRIISSDEQFDKVVEGMEILMSCKMLYESMLNEIHDFIFG